MHPFEQAIVANWPLACNADELALIAVSGGADSVALARAMCQIRNGKGCVVAHFNHRLRGDQSDRDEEFVRSLCNELGIEGRFGHWDRPSNYRPSGEGWESAARHERYKFLTAAAHAAGARYLLTAHSQDDQIETVLLRILRGTGVSGLAGIPVHRRLSEALTVVRPLLAIARTEVLAYLSRSAFREDASNQDRKFMRNRVRLKLLPLLRRHFSKSLDRNLLRIASLSAENQSCIDFAVSQLALTAISKNGPHEIILAKTALGPAPPSLVAALFIRIWKEHGWPRQQMNAQRWSDLAQHAQKTHRNVLVRTLPGTIRVEFLPTCVRLTKDQ